MTIFQNFILDEDHFLYSIVQYPPIFEYYGFVLLNGHSLPPSNDYVDYTSLLVMYISIAVLQILLEIPLPLKLNCIVLTLIHMSPKVLMFIPWLSGCVQILLIHY